MGFWRVQTVSADNQVERCRCTSSCTGSYVLTRQTGTSAAHKIKVTAKNSLTMLPLSCILGHIEQRFRESNISGTSSVSGIGKPGPGRYAREKL